ncbi:MAG TPA: hypothetical protein VN256_00350 [Pyrinomonadaceae bacterium]|nr:hypothetical protein [Pyrinomonadaceae bacterium]
MLASPHILAQAESTVYNLPTYFTWVFGLLLIAGGLAWLVATVLGFARARAFGVSTRWFAAASACLILYHAHWLALVFSVTSQNGSVIFPILASLNLFVVAGAVCTIIGFARLNAGVDSSSSSSS